MKNIFLFYIFIYVIVNGLWAQQSIGGKPLLNYRTIDAAIEHYAFPVLNNDSLKLFKVPCEYDTSANCGGQFVDVALNLGKDINQIGQWEIIDSKTKVWRIHLISPSALDISVMLERLYIPTGGKLFFIGKNGEFIDGAYTSLENNINSEGQFISRTFPGNEIIIEYSQPTTTTDKPYFIVKGVFHGYKRNKLASNNQRTLPCHNNVNCEPYEDYCNEIRSAMHMLVPFNFVRTNCTGEIVNEIRRFNCSAGLLNNAKNDFDPLVLTARHCIRSAIAEHWCVLDWSRTWGYPIWELIQFNFNFQSNVCSPDVPIFDFHTVLGATLIDDSGSWPTGTDLALLRLNRKPPLQANVYYAGWNRESFSDLNKNVTGVHHPDGDLKKISKGDLHYDAIYPTFWSVGWNDGITEGGSSGSPLFEDTDRRVIGALSWSVNNDCNDHNQQTRYGRLKDFWGKVGDDLSFDDLNRTTYQGADPIGSCQEDLELDGAFFPSSLYRLAKPDITIQAQDNIMIASNSATNVFNGITAIGGVWSIVNSDYLIRAGEKISIVGLPNQGFSIERGSRVTLEINPCEEFEQCGVNYFAKRSITETATSNDVEINIYPNPSTGMVTIDMSNAGFNKNYNLHVVDVMGKQVMNTSFEVNWKYEDQINIAHLANGLYIFNFTNETGELVKRIKHVKQ